MRWAMRVAAAALALALAGAPYMAQGADPAPAESFAQRSIAAGRLHIAFARLAARKAETPAVRRLADAIVRDGEKRIEALGHIAESEGAAGLASEVPGVEAKDLPARTRRYNHLRIRDGIAFDRQFL